MRGQKSQMKGMKAGQTIAAEREWAESDSERMLARKKQHRKQVTSVLIVVLMASLLGLMAYMWMKEAGTEYKNLRDEVPAYEIKAQIIDEERHGQISVRTRNYIAELEQALAQKGRRMTKVTLPSGKSRELYIDVEGREGFLKVSLDRGVAVTVEDAERMWRYLDEQQDVHPSYVDVRVEGKGYYL